MLAMDEDGVSVMNDVEVDFPLWRGSPYSQRYDGISVTLRPLYFPRGQLRLHYDGVDVETQESPVCLTC